ncbi:MAG: 3-phosphoshikimate 1-carboxyvinyltransferase [Bacteroidetes bacterium]|nr:MAG: 3-phosphoshikimate 1-carboxyvinyltransferase [Bacteroidota bacterium]
MKNLLEKPDYQLLKKAELLQISHPNGGVFGDILLPSSKSESNRVLIIKALSKNKIQLDNLSEARDTQTMQRLLSSSELTLDVLDAGTTMRFLTAFCAATQRKSILTGTERMCERPIGILVEALKNLGAEIEYLQKDGFPPIKINGFSQKQANLSIRGDVSSQYISALLMVAPTLPLGLTIELTGEIASRPYLQMTLDLMQHFGIQYVWSENSIKIEPQKYQDNQYFVESDWSGASYWYSVVALAENAEIKLLGLKENSLQGDKEIVEIMKNLGVKSVFEKDGVRLTKTSQIHDFEWDFASCPDLAQTIAVIAAAKGISLKMRGLQSLRIKETDRISALVTELAKINAPTMVIGDSELHILPAKIKAPSQNIHTYQDHRMAMAFAPLALKFGLKITEPAVVDKSYPNFWADFGKVGFEMN